MVWVPETRSAVITLRASIATVRRGVRPWRLTQLGREIASQAT
jgi:hypothetical protein